MIGYYGFEMNGSKHSIEVYIDGRPLLFADGSHYVEVFAERRDQAPGVHQRQSSEAIAAVLDKHRFTVSPAQHIHRSTIKWPCQHTMTTNPPSPCPYCEIEKLLAQVRELGGGSKSADYQKGYIAGRARYIYLKNKFDRIEAMLIEISNGRITDPVASAKATLEREKRNRRGGLCDDIGPAETATT